MNTQGSIRFRGIETGTEGIMIFERARECWGASVEGAAAFFDKGCGNAVVRPDETRTSSALLVGQSTTTGAVATAGR